MTRRIALAASVVAVGLCSIAGVARAEVLYDQTDHAGTPNVDSLAPNFSPSNDFGSGSFDRTADDFTVPAGQVWSANEVDVFGAYSGAAQGVVNVYIYPDTAGKPGTPLFSQTNISAPGGPDYAVPLANVPSLGPGAYWITVQQVVGMGGYWSWTTRTVQSGGPARWFGGMSDCPDSSWSPRTECWSGTNPDQVFRLSGSKTLIPNEIALGKLKRNKKRGTAILPVTVPGAGELSLSGQGVKAQQAARPVATQAVAGPGVVNLKVKAKGKAQRKLNRTGRARVKVTITFTPVGGTANSQQTKIKLQKKR
jgi:hypothetical protein